MNEDKFLLVKGIAGLGNRMSSALTGILYAHLTGQRLIVDWSAPIYSSNGSNIFHRFFQCSSCKPTDEIPATDSVRPSVWCDDLDESIIAMENRYGLFNNPKSQHKELSVIMREVTEEEYTY